MTIGQRLKFFRESRVPEQSQRDFADLLGTSLTTYQRYETDKSPPKLEFLQKLAALGCDIAWLIADLPAAPTQIQVQSRGEPTVWLPHYNARLSAGSGSSEPDRDEAHDLFVSEDFVRRSLRRSPRGLVVARATGASMAPTILDGDLLVIDTLDQRLQNGRIYAISVDGDLFVKRISKTLRGEVVLKSDNPDAGDPPEKISDDIAARVIGQVIWHGGSLE